MPVMWNVCIQFYFLNLSIFFFCWPYLFSFAAESVFHIMFLKCMFLYAI